MTANNNPPVQNHNRFMIQAIKQAEQAYDEDEVPIGAIVVYQNTIVGKGYNQVERLHDPTAHAEMLALSAACSTLNTKYLDGCTLYVTLEPCPMCTGALVWSKIDRIVFGASDTEYGACGSIFNLAHHRSSNHRIDVIQSIMEHECEAMLHSFFQEKREKD